MRIPSLSCRVSIAFGLVLAIAQSSLGQTTEELWRSRATGFESGHLDPQPVELVIARLEDELAAAPGDDTGGLATRFKLLEALYFQGHFLTPEPAQRRTIYDHMVALAEETSGLAEALCGLSADGGSSPPSPCLEGMEALVRSHFWSAISWGLWGMNHSRLRAGTAGVATKIRDHAQQVIDLDPEFSDGGGFRLLGRLHAATPKVVFFTGWIDRDLGIELLEQANQVSTADPRNPLFLGEALLRYRPAARQRALQLIEEVAGREPDPEYLVEESETIERARRILAQEVP